MASGSAAGVAVTVNASSPQHLSPPPPSTSAATPGLDHILKQHADEPALPPPSSSAPPLPPPPPPSSARATVSPVAPPSPAANLTPPSYVRGSTGIPPLPLAMEAAAHHTDTMTVIAQETTVGPTASNIMQHLAPVRQPPPELLAAAVSQNYYGSFAHALPVPPMPLVSLASARVAPPNVSSASAAAAAHRTLELVQALTPLGQLPFAAQFQLAATQAPATVSPQLLATPGFALIPDQQPCACQSNNTAPGGSSSVSRLGQPSSVGNPAPSSYYIPGRHRKRHREDSAPTRPKHQRLGSLAETGRPPSNIQMQSRHPVRDHLAAAASLAQTRSPTTSSRPQAAIPVQVPTVCTHCRRAVPPDSATATDAGSSTITGCTCPTYHTCPAAMTNFLNSLTQQTMMRAQSAVANSQIAQAQNYMTESATRAAQAPQRSFRPPPQAANAQNVNPPMMDPNNPLACLQNGSGSGSASEATLLNADVLQTHLSILNQQSRLIRQQQQMAYQQQVAQQQQNGYMQQQRPNLSLNSNINPEHAHLLAMRQQLSREHNETMNRFYNSARPIVPNVQPIQTEFLRPRNLQTSQMIVLPGLGGVNTGLDIVQLFMNNDPNGATTFLLPHNENGPQVAHAINHASEPQPVGASAESIKRCTQIRNYVKDPDVPEQERERCTVCLADFDNGEDVRTLHCSHIYHVDCIDRWLTYNKKCPVCRVDMDKAPVVISDDTDTPVVTPIRL